MHICCNLYKSQYYLSLNYIFLNNKNYNYICNIIYITSIFTNILIIIIYNINNNNNLINLIKKIYFISFFLLILYLIYLYFI